MKNADMPAMPQANQEIAKAFMDVEEVAPNGFTKREYLAAMAMQGLLASGPHDCDQHGIAHYALLQADALLAELENS